MAKIIEQYIAVKISKIVSDDSKETQALNTEQYITLVSSLAELTLSVVNDPSCVVEIENLKE